MRYDDLPPARHAQSHATSASPESCVAEESAQPGDLCFMNVIGPDDQLQINLDGDADDERADQKRTVPFLDCGGTEPESAADLEGRFLGRFHLESQIARGGMGMILEAPRRRSGSKSRHQVTAQGASVQSPHSSAVHQ